MLAYSLNEMRVHLGLSILYHPSAYQHRAVLSRLETMVEIAKKSVIHYYYFDDKLIKG